MLRNQITGAAICFFDMNDISSVFQKKNFQFLEDGGSKNFTYRSTFYIFDLFNFFYIKMKTAQEIRLLIHKSATPIWATRKKSSTSHLRQSLDTWPKLRCPYEKEELPL